MLSTAVLTTGWILVIAATNNHQPFVHGPYANRDDCLRVLMAARPPVDDKGRPWREFRASCVEITIPKE